MKSNINTNIKFPRPDIEYPSLEMIPQFFDPMTEPIDKVIIHSTATKEGQDLNALYIHQLHLQNPGWAGIGYNYVIKLDGTIEKGRDIEHMGAHTFGQNNGSIGICYIGGMDINDNPKDTRTPKQKNSMMALILYLLQKYHLTIEEGVHIHKEYKLTDCPSFERDTLLEELRAYFKEPR